MKTTESMLAVLARAESELPHLLCDGQGWNSLFVDYDFPHVKRLWREYDGAYRLYLHFIYSCEKNEAMYHTHSGPSAMKIVDGGYEMGVGYGSNILSPPPIAATLIMSAGSTYEMSEVYGWHYVRPVGGVTVTIMVAGKPWENKISPKSTKALDPLSDSDVEMILSYFRNKYPQ